MLRLVLTLAGLSLGFAPAPVYKEEKPSLESAHRALPKALRDQIERNQRGLPAMVERYERLSKGTWTPKQKDILLRTVEMWKEARYISPIHYLEYQRKQPAYQSREDQATIETALKFYRIQYEEAKKKGLFRPQE